MEFRKKIVATCKEMNDAFNNGFGTNKVRVKFTEALELKGTEKYLQDNMTYTFNTLFRASEDFKIPKNKTMTIKEFKKHINKMEKVVEEKTMDIKEQYEYIRDVVETLMNENLENFVKSVISVEKGINDINVLDNVYYELMDSDVTNFLSEDIEGLIAEYTELENDKEDVKLDYEKDDDTRNINGYMANDIEIKTLTNRNGEKFNVANFSIAENDDMGNVHYTNCTAYNDKIDKVKNFKKGDFVHLFGKEKISYGKDDKEYVNLTILSAKMLKEKKVYKETDKTQNKKKSKSMGKTKTDKNKSSIKSKLKEYKEKAYKTVSKNKTKTKSNER